MHRTRGAIQYNSDLFPAGRLKCSKRTQFLCIYCFYCVARDNQNGDGVVNVTPSRIHADVLRKRNDKKQ